MGLHGPEPDGDEYDTPVWDEVGRQWVPLALWARRHWCPNGGGVTTPELWHNIA
jgi:hypothetical protein